MPTALITLPGTLTTVPAGMEEAVILQSNGFVSRGLAALYLLSDGSGTVLADALGGSSGAIDNISSSNNAYAHLSGGGISLSGAQLASMPAFDQSAPWTLMTAGAATANTAAVGERIVGLIGTRDFGLSPQRGAYLYFRGPASLAVETADGRYVHRLANGSGGQAAAEDLTPGGLVVAQRRRVYLISYDGSSQVNSRVYDGLGTLIASDTTATNDATLFTVSGASSTTLQWVLGGFSVTYGGGLVQHEVAARYTRAIGEFSTAEITAICAAAAAIGAARGRTWT